MTVTSVRDAAIAAPPPKPTARRRVGGTDRAGWVTYLLLGVVAFLSLLPFYYMVVSASRTMAEMNASPPPLLPGPLLWDNIKTAMEVQPIGKAIVNSMIVSGAVAAGTILFCTAAGFAFAKLRFRSRDAMLAHHRHADDPAEARRRPAVPVDGRPRLVRPVALRRPALARHRLRRVLHAAVPRQACRPS